MKDVLVGWKEISSFLRVCQKTAIRYYKQRGLPVVKDPAGHPTMKKETAEMWRLNDASK